MLAYINFTGITSWLIIGHTFWFDYSRIKDVPTCLQCCMDIFHDAQRSAHAHPVCHFWNQNVGQQPKCRTTTSFPVVYDLAAPFFPPECHAQSMSQRHQYVRLTMVARLGGQGIYSQHVGYGGRALCVGAFRVVHGVDRIVHLLVSPNFQESRRIPPANNNFIKV